MSATTPQTGSLTLADLAGTDLGSKTLGYDDTAAILYALSVGAASTDLDLVYERDLRVLPTLGCALGLWAVEASGRLGAYDPRRSLHASQRLQVHAPFPASGDITMSGRIAAVHDKGKASVVDIEVESEIFSAGYSIFLPGLGGWGGDRGPSAAPAPEVDLTKETAFETSPDLAALYRLTGDRHPVHIDPNVAQDNGFYRPILHGLCTLGIAARIVAEQVGAHPSDLTSLEVRLASPVLPGDSLTVRSGSPIGVDEQSERDEQAEVFFDALVGATAVLSSGRARFAR